MLEPPEKDGELLLYMGFECVLDERGLAWEGAEFFHDAADEGVAVAEVVVEEGKGLGGGDGFEPEGELGEFDGDGVEVDAVEAVFDDFAFPVDEGGGVVG